MRHQKTGFVRFVLVRGLIGFGIPVLAFWTCYAYFVIGDHDSITVGVLKRNALIFSGGGLFFGIAFLSFVLWAARRN
jgi:hypothetical protein